ncbi:MAG: ATP-binding protein [Gemmatimonadaceae bacterium]
MGRIAQALLSLDPLNEVATLGLAESLALEGSKVRAIQLLEAYETEIGAIDDALRVPVRLLRRRVSENLSDATLPRRFEVALVGREQEFSHLRALLRDAKNGGAAGAFLTGEAGVGKTRLAAETLRLATLDGYSTVSYCTSAGDACAPLTTLVSLADKLLALPGALGCRQEHLQYLKRLGTPEAVTAWNVTGMSADVLYAQFLISMVELVSAITDEAPLVLFFDGADRLHSTTLRVLFDVWERVSQRRVMLLFAARTLPSEFGSFSPRSCEHFIRHIQVSVLEASESEGLLDMFCAKHGIALESGRRLECALTARGNPFYLTELVRHLARGGDPAHTPSSITELLALQLTQLSLDAGRTLIVVAIFDKRATTSRLSRVLELSTDRIVAAVSELDHAGLVTPTDGVLHCRHSLVRDATLAHAPMATLAVTRAAVAAVLERVADESDSVELLGECISLWNAIGDRMRAYDVAMKLGSRLMGVGLGDDAERAFALALDLADHDSQRSHACEAHILASRLSAHWTTMKVVTDRRLAIHAATPSHPHRCDEYDLLGAEASLFSAQRAPNRQQLLDLAANGSQSSALRLRAASILSILADNEFDRDLMAHSCSRIADLPSSAMSSVDGVSLSLVYHTAMGNRDVAVDIAEQLLDLASDSGDIPTRLTSLRRASHAFLRIGAPEKARLCYEKLCQVARHLQLLAHESDALEGLACAYLAMDELSEVRRCSRMLHDLPEHRDPDHIRSLLLVDISLAWAEQNPGWASRSASILHTVDCSPISRAAQTLRTLQGALLLLERPTALDGETTEKLSALHEAGQYFGGQDLATSVIAESLRRGGQTASAVNMLKHYLDHARRELHAPPTFLSKLRDSFARSSDSTSTSPTTLPHRNARAPRSLPE